MRKAIVDNKIIKDCFSVDLCIYGTDCAAGGCAWTYESEHEDRGHIEGLSPEQITFINERKRELDVS